MKIKYIVYIFLGAVAILSSCSDFLDETPKVQTSARTYYSNDSQANTAVIGLYSFLQDEQAQINPFMVFGDDCSDDCTLGNSKSEAWSWFGGVAQQMVDFETQPNNWISNQPWAEFWRAISNCTQAIERIEANKEAIGSNSNQYLGEAHFLRALYYFFLTREYGGLPIMDHVFTYGEYFTPRASQADTWKFIEQEFTIAASLLPEKSKYADSDLGRATKGAALSFLGKTYVYENKWQEAYDVFNKVIASNEYSLEPNYSDIFTLEHENGVESIFEIQHGTSGTGWSNSNEGSILSFYEHDADPNNSVKWQVGWSMHCPTQDLVDTYELNDPRLHATIIFPNEMFDGHINKNVGSRTGYQSKKWYVPYAQRSHKDQSDNPKNIIVMRYADILLHMAETCNELGKFSEALTYLNMVRDRARNSTTEKIANLLPAVTTTDQSALREAIYHERRVELACEGQRFYDIVRQGRAGKIMKAYNAKYGNKYGENKAIGWTDGKSELLPIPQDQLDLYNEALKQNPNY